MIYKQYHIQMKTPLGLEDVLLNIRGEEARITIGSGSATTKDIFYEGDSFKCTFELEVPICCTAIIFCKIVNDGITGHVTVDDYLFLEFNGKESRAKLISN